MIKVSDETKAVMFKTFIQVQSMDDVPHFVKNKMLSAIFKMNPNKWRVVGITEQAVIRFAENDFKREWSHLYNYPILAKRDKKYNIFKRFLNRQKKNMNRILNKLK